MTLHAGAAKRPACAAVWQPPDRVLWLGDNLPDIEGGDDRHGASARRFASLEMAVLDLCEVVLSFLLLCTMLTMLGARWWSPRVRPGSSPCMP
jgi:hypothetical protein